MSQPNARPQWRQLTDKLADFVVSTRYEHLSSDVLASARQGFIDNLGVALAGSHQPDIQIMIDVVKAGGGAGKATVVGRRERVSPLNAAMINGHAAHALDFDDTQHGRATHMSAPVVPAVLAAGEARHCSGKDALAAYVVGFEVGVGLGGAAEFGEFLVHKRGIHPTGYLGHLGAAAAVGNLIGLDAGNIRRAFGIAATQAAGQLRTIGTMCKPINAAKAATNGLLSALLAEKGFTGPEDTFDGEQNLFFNYGFNVEAKMMEELGRRFEIIQNGLKVYACAGWRNSIINGMIHLSRTHNLRAQDIAEIRIWASQNRLELPNYPEPQTGLEGKFSSQHCAAVALVERAGSVDQFSDEKVKDTVLVELRRKVSISLGEHLGRYQIDFLVRTKHGRELKHSVPIPKGDPGNPFTQEEVEEKFRTNASLVLPSAKVTKLMSMIRNLEDLPDLTALLRACRPG